MEDTKTLFEKNAQCRTVRAVDEKEFCAVKCDM